MNKTKVYILELILLTILSYTLIFNKILDNKIKVAIFLLIFAVLTKFILKNKRILSIKRKDVLKLMLFLGFTYVALLYTVGIYTGFYKSIIRFSFKTLTLYILPITIIIVTSEYLRDKFLNYKGKIILVLNFLIQIIIDLLIYANTYKFNKLEDIMTLVGYVLFASISTNLLHNYIGKRYGVLPNIIYRLFVTLYLYIIPITPDIYMFFLSFYRMLFPLIIYYIIDSFYGETEEAIELKSDKIIRIISSFAMVIIIMYIGLISCKFRYGALVIGSGSMTGTIDMGDVIIFSKNINENKVEKNDIIVFNKDDVKVVHRVIDKKSSNNEIRFYTKGDANKLEDDGYITESELYGSVKLRIKKIGWPTLWLNDMFNRSKK